MKAITELFNDDQQTLALAPPGGRAKYQGED
ncbi:hypothetical protein SAMN05216600_107151 [Pseudomonas cuatrocienegasensis]|uniref:Uncharacterized protein n=1 Tax=Pseudomonas cuatrocienegasensis TaxID=543360 RepID=A0ABY1BDA6_9PSED|nr:hypothetical protein SAMN05216600_107151 [Pseudomonas cuatrocienegasensis]